MTLYLGENLISGVATPVQGARNIGQLITSLLPISDAGLHLVDGALIDGSGMYAQFVDYVSKLDLSASYFCTEDEWQASVAQYGVCGKFVYDATANTVRLPKVTGLIEGTIDVNALGDLVEAGLPNITGSVSRGSAADSGLIDFKNAVTTEGAFKVLATGSNSHTGTSSSSKTVTTKFGIDASLSNSIYGNSDTVQPQTIKGFVYIVIATSTKTDVEVNIDNIATDVNGKADVDGTNWNNSIDNIDGQWIISEKTLSTATAKGTYTIDLSSYLPNDGYIYEVMFNHRIYCTTDCAVFMTTDLLTLRSDSSIIGQTSSNARWATNTFIKPIGLGRTATLEIITNNAEQNPLIAMAFRRIGTNQ